MGQTRPGPIQRARRLCQTALEVLNTVLEVLNDRTELVVRISFRGEQRLSMLQAMIEIRLALSGRCKTHTGSLEVLSQPLLLFNGAGQCRPGRVVLVAILGQPLTALSSE
jgi:hypothetical protein